MITLIIRLDICPGLFSCIRNQTACKVPKCLSNTFVETKHTISTNIFLSLFLLFLDKSCIVLFYFVFSPPPGHREGYVHHLRWGRLRRGTSRRKHQAQAQWYWGGGMFQCTRWRKVFFFTGIEQKNTLSVDMFMGKWSFLNLYGWLRAQLITLSVRIESEHHVILILFCMMHTFTSDWKWS